MNHIHVYKNYTNSKLLGKLVYSTTRIIYLQIGKSLDFYYLYENSTSSIKKKSVEF